MTGHWPNETPPTPTERAGRLYRELRSLASEMNKDRLELRRWVRSWANYYSQDIRRKASNVWQGAMLAVVAKELDIERGKVRKLSAEVDSLRQRPAVTVTVKLPEGRLVVGDYLQPPPYGPCSHPAIEVGYCVKCGDPVGNP